MHTKVKDLTDSKKFPSWFIQHPIFSEITHIKKVFPSIGLPNSEIEIELGVESPAKKSASKLLRSISIVLINRLTYLKKNKKIVKTTAGKRIAATIDAVIKVLDKSKKDCIRENGARITINIPKDILLQDEDRPVFRSGESLFRVFNKINDMLVEAESKGLTKLDSLSAFKTFSADNIPNSKFKIRFSSTGVDGALDIGSMSSRGIRSCQSWDRGEYKHCTIGSVIDPFVGIIFLTSGSKYNEYGSKMIRRCIVRFAVNENTNKAFLLLDHMYPSLDKNVLAKFKTFIKEKTQNKFEVYYTEDASSGQILNESYVPLTDIRHTLAHIDRHGKKNKDLYDLDSIGSYQDYKIKDKCFSRKQYLIELYKRHSNKKEQDFICKFSEEFKRIIKEFDPKNCSAAVKDVSAKITKHYNANVVAASLGVSIADAILDGVNQENFTNSNTYLRQVHYNYFINKNKILRCAKIKTARYLNEGVKKQHQLASAAILAYLNAIFPELNKFMKESIKKLVFKKNKSESNDTAVQE